MGQCEQALMMRMIGVMMMMEGDGGIRGCFEGGDFQS